MDASEILLILVVGIIVVGPKRLPVMMRTLGRWIAKARRTIFEVRANTGIDKLIREEGLEKEVRELSSLTRSNVLSTLVANNPVAAATRSISGALATPPTPSPKPATSSAPTAKKAVVQELAPSDASAPAELAAASSASAASAAPAEPVLMGGPAPSAAALALIKPAVGNVSKRDEDVLRLLMRTATGSTRDREYPTIGCDAYDVMPDDIDDPEAYEDPPADEDEDEADDEAPAAEAAAPPTDDAGEAGMERAV